MARQEDALNKLWEQSISYNGTINFALADGEREDAGFYFYTDGRENTNKQVRDEEEGDNNDMTVQGWIKRNEAVDWNKMKKWVTHWYRLIYNFLFNEMWFDKWRFVDIHH